MVVKLNIERLGQNEFCILLTFRYFPWSGKGALFTFPTINQSMFKQFICMAINISKVSTSINGYNIYRLFCGIHWRQSVHSVRQYVAVYIQITGGKSNRRHGIAKALCDYEAILDSHLDDLMEKV